MTQLRQNSLVLYKNRPARITVTGDKKIEIETPSGALKVRPKDVELLHPGPLSSLAALRPPHGDIETAWELLAGDTTSLQTLSELAYDSFTPQTAWAIWELLDDGLLFSGTPDAIRVHTADEVAAERQARAAKAAEAQAWEAFLERVGQGAILPEDGRFFQDVVAVALGQSEKSAVLRALDRPETPQSAHRLLLQMGFWDVTVNPYPQRAGLPAYSSRAALDPLPEEQRRDLTHLTALAIDDDGNQDPDDALSWEDGILWVHVADVAALVPPDSSADVEARSRGANLYLPEGTVTMLPPDVTRQLGLGLQDISPALSFALEMDDEGQLVDVEIVPSRVRVTRMSYAEAEERLHERPFAELLVMADRYQARRRASGAIEIDLPEVRVRVTDGVVDIRPLPPLRSRDLVREAMLMTGEAVARFAFERGIPLPYTVQDAPSELLEPLATPSQFFAQRKLMQPGRQSPTPGAHAGLGMGFYAQATSPLRRYLDLVVHQQLRAYLRGERPLDEEEVMGRVGAALAATLDTRWAERQSLRHWTLVYMLQQPEWQGEGVVIEERHRKFTVLIPALASETRMSLPGATAVDDVVQIAFSEANLPELEGYFRSAGR